ncbi:MAG: hypothetical protein JWN72_1319 [Thermoleophilia bacterium]|nr:hypothetical protein [Thermoleophilia bacterium]
MRWGTRLRFVTPLACVAGCLFAPSPAHATSFVVKCASTHVASDDPIVFPGQAGASHRHEFYGARGVTAASTAAQLHRSPSSCRLRADTASYWAPTLEVDGRLVRGSLAAYYTRGAKPRAAALPAGLKLVAGDMRAAAPQSMRVTDWQCVGGRARTLAGAPVQNPHLRTVPTTCRADQRLGAWVRFPDCWNGRDLDTADHRSHLAYASPKGACPASHPVAVMQLQLLITWPVRPRGASRITLAGGRLGATGMHADFWNTWQQPTLRQLRWNCIEVAANCGELSSGSTRYSMPWPAPEFGAPGVVGAGSGAMSPSMPMSAGCDCCAPGSASPVAFSRRTSSTCVA